MKKQKLIQMFINVAMCILLLLPTSMKAQERFDFNMQETKEFADFFKQKATDGKTNAEALGIKIDATGFSWDDMNTWKNDKGVAFTKFEGSKNIYTPWGVAFSPDAPRNGKALKISWSNKYGKESYTPANELLGKLQGSLKLTKNLCTHVQMGFTSIDNVALEMQNGAGTGDGVIEKWVECYIKLVDNPKLKVLDLSNSTGHLRQIEAYRNALEILKMENVCQESFMGGKDKNIKIYYFAGWAGNIEKNYFSFSSLPENPCRKGFVFGSFDINGNRVSGGYKDQYYKSPDGVGGMPIGTADGKGNYYVEVNEKIDLSAEYQPKGAVTTFTWKNVDDGTTVTPSRSINGLFAFDNSFIGKTLVCEIRNADFPMLILNSVDVTVVAKGTSIEEKHKESSEINAKVIDDFLEINSAITINSLEIYSLAGMRMMSIANPNNLVDISSLNAGIYMVKISTINGEKILKVIK